MNMYELIDNILTNLNVPNARLKYSGNAETYIVWQEYLEQGEGFSEDDEEITTHYLQFNVYSKKDNTNLVANLKQGLKQAGFIREQEFDGYEPNNDYFNRVLRYYYI